MSVGSSISENQVQSDSDLEDGLFSLAEDDEIFSESDDGAYISADESLEGTLDASFKSIPCTVVISGKTYLIQVISGKMLTLVLVVFASGAL